MPLQKIADPAKREALMRYLEAATDPARKAGGGEAAYVETLPRRGYRLTRSVSRVGDSLPAARRRSKRVLVISALITGAVGAALAVVVLVSLMGSPQVGRLR